VWDRSTSTPGERCQRRHGPYRIYGRCQMVVDLAKHRSVCALERVESTEAGGAHASAQGGEARREPSAASGCAVFLSTALAKVVCLVRLSARRRSRSSLALDSAKPHPALVLSLGRAPGPQISRRSGYLILASPNSPAIANGSRGAKTASLSPPQVLRSLPTRNLP